MNIVPLLTLSTTNLCAVSKCLWPQKYTEGCLMRKDSWTPLQNIVWRGFHCILKQWEDHGNVANRKISILTDAVRMKTFCSNSTCFDGHMQHIRAHVSCKFFLRHWIRGEKVQKLIFLWSFLQWVKRWEKKSLDSCWYHCNRRTL